MATPTYSQRRVVCADYRRKHKKKAYFNKTFRCVRDLGLQDVKNAFLPCGTIDVLETDYLCGNCVAHFRSLRAAQPHCEAGSSSGSSDDPTYRQDKDYVEMLNESVASTSLEISPFKPSGQVKHKASYAKRKSDQLEKEFSKKARRLVSLAYGEEIPQSSLPEDQLQQWELNARAAFLKAESIQEKCLLLTLLPSSYSTGDIQKLIPEATKYVILKAKKLQAEAGIWSRPDPYVSRNEISAQDVADALEYYTKDELDCSVQSPRPRDVVTVNDGGKKSLTAKRYMTRTIREAYRQYKTAHPASKLGLTKFYSLRPKWVVLSPYREECVCSYCANFSLCVNAINSISEGSFSEEQLKAMCMCSPATEQCERGECRICPRKDCFTIRRLELHERCDVELALWETGRLEKKDMPLETFLDTCFLWITKHIRHKYVKDVQKEAIRKEKTSVRPQTVLFHFDFAENWTVVVPDAVQSYHWKKTQISIFTCVMTTSSRTHSFAVVSDDMRHDSAFATLALEKIDEWVDENVPVYAECVYISDGASAHFKNRYQAFEMSRTPRIRKWLFSAPGHGKNACDGVGGVVKHIATVHNLRCSSVDVIQTADDLVSKLTSRCPNVVLMHVSRSDVEKHRTLKLELWKAAKPIPNLRNRLLWLRTTQDKVVYKISAASL